MGLIVSADTLQKNKELANGVLQLEFRLPVSTKDPTQDMNPDKKELKGNVPTRRQYRNCMIPVAMM